MCRETGLGGGDRWLCTSHGKGFLFKMKMHQFISTGGKFYTAQLLREFENRGIKNNETFLAFLQLLTTEK